MENGTGSLRLSLLDGQVLRGDALARVLEALGHALLALEIWIVLRAIGFHVVPIDPLVMEGGVQIIDSDSGF